MMIKLYYNYVLIYQYLKDFLLLFNFKNAFHLLLIVKMLLLLNYDFQLINQTIDNINKEIKNLT